MQTRKSGSGWVVSATRGSHHEGGSQTPERPPVLAGRSSPRAAKRRPYRTSTNSSSRGWAGRRSTPSAKVGGGESQRGHSSLATLKQRSQGCSTKLATPLLAGHPALIGRHAPFDVSPAAAERWLHHMSGALDATPEIDPDSRRRMWNFFRHTAYFLVGGQELMRERAAQQAAAAAAAAAAGEGGAAAGASGGAAAGPPPLP